MNIEERNLFVATPGGFAHALVLTIEKERNAAYRARVAYLKSKGRDVLGLWGTDSSICALVVKSDKIPTGWRRDSKLHRKHCAPDDGVFAVPDGKQRETYKELKQELRSLPKLLDFLAFTDRIGTAPQLYGMRMLLATYEKVSGNIVISVPKPGDSGSRTPFVPKDCTPLKWSEYYAMKEAVAENNT